MAIMSLAMYGLSTPQQAVAKMFKNQVVLAESDLEIFEVPAGEFGDRAWRWVLSPSAPVVLDMGGEPFAIDPKTKRAKLLGDAGRYHIRRGVVLELVEEGEMYVAADVGEDESDASLVELAASMIGEPARAD